MRTDNCGGLSADRCSPAKQHGHGCHKNTARKKWTKEEKKTAISSYLKVTKESKRGYINQMNLQNEMGVFEIEEQHLTC